MQEMTNNDESLYVDAIERHHISKGHIYKKVAFGVPMYAMDPEGVSWTFIKGLAPQFFSYEYDTWDKEKYFFEPY